MSTLIALLILVLIAGLLWWAITQIPLPAPIAQIVQVVFVIIIALMLVGMLFGGVPLPTLRL
jgi:hypothetical protein